MRHSTFAKFDQALALVHEDLDLAKAWARDRPLTIANTAARRRHRLDGELAKIGVEWWLNDTSTAAGRVSAAIKAPRTGLALAKEALPTTWEEAAQLLYERQAVAGPPTPSFRR